MKVNSIQLINFEKSLTSADIIISNDKDEVYIARIHEIDMLLDQIKNTNQANTALNYIYLPNTLVVDEISEDYMFEIVNNLIEDGDFFNVFKKV